MKKRPISLSIFFPAYNEEANIAASVAQAETVAKTITDTYEIIVVNDGSQDKTGAIADTLAAENPHIRVVHHAPNQGYGAAVWSGIQAARYDYVFFTDADLQFDLSELTKLVAYVPKYRVVLGYRAKRRDPFMRLLNAKGWNLLNRFLFGLKVKDIDCAFKLFERKLLQDLPLKSRGAMLSAELLIHLQRRGTVFKEVPVTHLPRTWGSPTGAEPKVILRAFNELFQTYRGQLGNVSHRQLVKFAIVGVANTLLDLLLYVVLTRTTTYFSDHLIVAKALTFFIGSVFSFFTNRAWTFRRKTHVNLGEIGRFYLTVGIALVINVLSLFVLLRIFPQHDLLAVLVATIFTFAWNFVVSKFWVFASRERKLSYLTIPPLDAALLIALISATLVSMILWLRIDTYPPHWDMANHLHNSLTYTDDFRKILESENLKQMLRTAYTFFIGRETYYPPFLYWTSAPFILAFGRTFMAAVLSNSIFLVILTFTSYAIGRKLWNRTTGILTALVVLTYPFIVGQFHEFQLDMPLTVMAFFALWALLQTNRWQNWGWSFLFGVIFGLGMLTKWPLPAFLIGPVVYELTGRIRAILRLPPDVRGVEYKKLGIGLALSALGLLLAAGPWYGRHSLSLKKNLGINWQTGTGEGDPSPLSSASLRLYSDVLLKAQIRLLMLVPFVIGIVTTFLRKENLHKNGVILAMLLGGYSVMTLYNNKDYRFIEPVLGAVAVLSVYWISQLVKPWRYLAITYVVCVAIFQFLSVGWGSRLFPTLVPKIEVSVPDIQEGKFWITVWEFTGYGSGPPKAQVWPQEEIIETIYKTNQQQAEPQSLIRLAMYYRDNMEFNRENVRYTILQKQYPMTIVPGPPATFHCGNVDYVIATTPDGIADAVFRDFPYYQDYYYDDKNAGPPQLPRLTTPLCQLKPIYQNTLPNKAGVYVWQVIR